MKQDFNVQSFEETYPNYEFAPLTKVVLAIVEQLKRHFARSKASAPGVPKDLARLGKP